MQLNAKLNRFIIAFELTNILDYISLLMLIGLLEELNGLLEELNGMNVKLEEIQKSLDMYLETKRQIFP